MMHTVSRHFERRTIQHRANAKSLRALQTDYRSFRRFLLDYPDPASDPLDGWLCFRLACLLRLVGHGFVDSREDFVQELNGKE